MLSKSDLKGQKLCIYGVQGTGKTVFARVMQRKFDKWKKIIYLVNEDDDWTKEKGLWIWKSNTQNIKQDFEDFINFVYEKIKEQKINLIIIDEADLFFRTNYDIAPKFRDLILNHRHRGKKGEGVALWFITRRPQDIPTTIVETAKHSITFLLEGANAKKKLYEIDENYKEKLKYLKFDKFNFLYKKIGEKPQLMNKLKYDGQKQVR